MAKVIFISLDTVGAGRLSLFGGDRVATPNLARLAERGAVFSRAFASDIPTQPSHTAVFTGRYGVTTGIVSHFHPPATLDESVAWLPSLMRDEGRPTGAVDHLFSMKDWFIRGYDDYMVPPGRSRSPGSVINDLGMPWIEAHARDDFFLFLHFWDAHIPYVPPEPFLSEFTADSTNILDLHVLDKIQGRPTYPLFKRNLYQHLERIPNLEYVADLHRAEIAYLDYEIGRLLDHLEQLGILDDVLIVAFGDHGENMTEHDAWFDHAGLYDTVVHVPLLISGKGVPRATVDSLVSLVDVMPTVLDLMGMDTPAGLDGRSLMPVMRGESQVHRDHVMLSECTWLASRGIRTDRWKFIRCYDSGVYDRPECELYDLDADEFEQTNIASDRPDLIADFQAKLDRWLTDRRPLGEDPIDEVVSAGLPAVERLMGVIREDNELAARISMESYGPSASLSRVDPVKVQVTSEWTGNEGEST
jgi:arylsulfatase A-like enzyme